MNRKSIKFIIGGVLILGIVIAVFTSISSENLTYYFTPDEVLKDPSKFSSEKIRIMGLVEEGSVKWEPKETKLDFRITEDSETYLNVTYQGSKPDMFKEGQGVVVEGKMSGDQIFVATTLLVKHTEEYKREEEHTDKSDYYKSINP